MPQRTTVQTSVFETHEGYYPSTGLTVRDEDGRRNSGGSGARGLEGHVKVVSDTPGRPRGGDEGEDPGTRVGAAGLD